MSIVKSYQEKPALAVDDNVLWFDIAVYGLLHMHLLDYPEQLSNQIDYLILGQFITSSVGVEIFF